MKTYCVNCKKYSANKNSTFKRNKHNRSMTLSNCVAVARKK